MVFVSQKSLKRAEHTNKLFNGELSSSYVKTCLLLSEDSYQSQ